ncbi:hypothetical protein T08_8364, partial [Trichinella sp. T8]
LRTALDVAFVRRMLTTTTAAEHFPTPSTKKYESGEEEII